MADAGVVGDLVRVDLVGVGGDVVQRVELVDARAGHPEREPREDAAGQDDEGEQDDEDGGRLERDDPDEHRARDEHRADHDGRDHERAAVLQADHGDQARRRGRRARRRGAGRRRRRRPAASSRRAGRRARAGARRPRRRAAASSETTTPASGSLLGAGQHDAADDEQAGDHRGGDAAEHALALQQQGERAEAEQDAARAQRRTPSCRRLPRLELVLDDVGHRLDDVVVDARGLVVDAGGDGEEAAVLDALHRQAGVVDQDPALLGHQAVAAVDGGGVEQADRAGELGHELGDRDRARQHEIDPSRPRGDGHPDQARGDRGPLTHWCFPLIVLAAASAEGPGH